MRLDIILRTHDGESVHPRSFNKPKKDIVWRCLNSLGVAMEPFREPKIPAGQVSCDVYLPNALYNRYQINLIILDDHSSPETVEFLKDFGDVISLEETGNNASMLAALQLGQDSEADIVYMLEDDYLHQPDALSVALETWSKFYQKNSLPLMGMSLVDCPTNYESDIRDGSAAHIMGGTDRPWRTVDHTTYTFLLERGVLQSFPEPFEECARYWPFLEEIATFNKLWNKKVGMYCPLVPLTYHLFENHPFYPVDKLWGKNKCLKSKSTPMLKLAS